MASARKYKCPFCSKSFERPKLASHIDKYHDDMLNPDKGYTFGSLHRKTGRT